MSKAKKIVVPLSVPPDLKAQITKAASQSKDLSEQDIMRIAIRKGLPLLAEMFADRKAAA